MRRASSKLTVDPLGAAGLVRRGVLAGLGLVVAGIALAGRDLRLGFLGIQAINLVWCGLGVLSLTLVGLWFGTKGQARSAQRLAVIADARAADRVLIVGPPSGRLLHEFVVMLSPVEPVAWAPPTATSALEYAGGVFDLVVYQSTRNGQPGPRDQDLSELARVLAPGGRMLVVELVNAARHAEAMASAGLDLVPPNATGRLTRVVIGLGLAPDMVRGDKPKRVAGPDERSHS